MLLEKLGGGGGASFCRKPTTKRRMPQANVQTALGNIEKLSEEIAARERLVEKHREIVG